MSTKPYFERYESPNIVIVPTVSSIPSIGNSHSNILSSEQKCPTGYVLPKTSSELLNYGYVPVTLGGNVEAPNHFMNTLCIPEEINIQPVIISPTCPIYYPYNDSGNLQGIRYNVTNSTAPSLNLMGSLNMSEVNNLGTKTISEIVYPVHRNIDSEIIQSPGTGSIHQPHHSFVDETKMNTIPTENITSSINYTEINQCPKDYNYKMNTRYKKTQDEISYNKRKDYITEKKYEREDMAKKNKHEKWVQHNSSHKETRNIYISDEDEDEEIAAKDLRSKPYKISKITEKRKYEGQKTESRELYKYATLSEAQKNNLSPDALKRYLDYQHFLQNYYNKQNNKKEAKCRQDKSSSQTNEKSNGSTKRKERTIDLSVTSTLSNEQTKKKFDSKKKLKEKRIGKLATKKKKEEPKVKLKKYDVLIRKQEPEKKTTKYVIKKKDKPNKTIHDIESNKTKKESHVKVVPIQENSKEKIYDETISQSKIKQEKKAPDVKLTADIKRKKIIDESNQRKKIIKISSARQRSDSENQEKKEETKRTVSLKPVAKADIKVASTVTSVDVNKKVNIDNKRDLNKVNDKIDLRTMLTRKRSLNQGHTVSKRIKTSTPQCENVVITVKQDVSTKSRPVRREQIASKPKDKKSKTIKLVINIQCPKSTDSDSEQSANEYSTSPHQDLSFLDDFDIDDIVDSLNYSTKEVFNDTDVGKFDINQIESEALASEYDVNEGLVLLEKEEIKEQFVASAAHTHNYHDTRQKDENIPMYQKVKVAETHSENLHETKDTKVADTNTNGGIIGLCDDVYEVIDICEDTENSTILLEEDVICIETNNQNENSKHMIKLLNKCLTHKIVEEPKEVAEKETIMFVNDEPKKKTETLNKSDTKIYTVMNDTTKAVEKSKTEEINNIVSKEELNVIENKDNVIKLETQSLMNKLSVANHLPIIEDSDIKSNTEKLKEQTEEKPTDCSDIKEDSDNSMHSKHNERSQDVHILKRNGKVGLSSKEEVLNDTVSISSPIKKNDHLPAKSSNETENSNKVSHSPNLHIPKKHVDENRSDKMMQEITELDKNSYSKLTETSVTKNDMNVKPKLAESEIKLNDENKTVNESTQSNKTIPTQNITEKSNSNVQNKEITKDIAISKKLEMDKESYHVDYKTCEEIVSNLNKPDIRLLEKRMFEYLGEKFTITTLLHEGYYSKIFKCKDATGDAYSIKVLKNGYQNLGIHKDKMLSGLQKYTTMDSYFILEIIHSFNSSGKWCFLTDFYPKTLAEAMEYNKKCFHIDLVQILARQLVSAVAMLTNSQIIHTDIKPSHILLDSTNRRLKLCGFDRADYNAHIKIIPASGTSNYRAPEIILGFDSDYRIDVWATALVMFEMAAGIKLFPGRFNNDILYKQLCTLGPLDFNMLKESLYQKRHFTGTKFKRQVGEQKWVLVHFFGRNNKLRHKLFASYNREWKSSRTHWQVTQDLDKIEMLYRLLEQMLVMDPRHRLPINFVAASDFIHDNNGSFC